jgi:hypothetical protein
LEEFLGLEEYLVYMKKAPRILNPGGNREEQFWVYQTR